MAGALAGKAAGPDYGLDSPALVRDWWHRAGWFAAIGAGFPDQISSALAP